MHARRTLPLLLIAALLISSFLILAPAARAQASTITVVTTNSVRLRSGPGASYDSLATIPYNTSLSATGRNADNSWIQVDYNGILGWVSAQFLRYEGDVNSLPVDGIQAPPPAATEAPPAAPPPQAGDLTATNSNILNVRSGPGTSYATLGKLPANSTITLTGRWGSGGQAWVRFVFNGVDGWLASWLLRINGDVNSLPDLQAAIRAAEVNVQQMCITNAGEPMAAAWVPGPGIHPLLMFNEGTNTAHPWFSSLAANWRAAAPLSAQLVACIGPEARIKIEHCYYNGPDIERFQYQMPVRLLAAQTGQVVSQTMLFGAPPRECRNTEPWSLTVLAGPHVSTADLRAWLDPYVEP